jgi:hypothetical protein
MNMRNQDHDAAKPNPALEALGALVGEWRTIGKHPYLPGKTLHGRTSFAWLEGGAFLIMRSETDEPDIPDGLAIFGSDDSLHEYFMLYFDERGVSRKYDVKLSQRGLVWARNDPAFAQRFTIDFASDGQTMSGRGEMSKDGAAWEPDLELTYAKVT